MLSGCMPALTGRQRIRKEIMKRKVSVSQNFVNFWKERIKEIRNSTVLAIIAKHVKNFMLQLIIFTYKLTYCAFADDVQ